MRNLAPLGGLPLEALHRRADRTSPTSASSPGCRSARSISITPPVTRSPPIAFLPRPCVGSPSRSECQRRRSIARNERSLPAFGTVRRHEFRAALTRAAVPPKPPRSFGRNTRPLGRPAKKVNVSSFFPKDGKREPTPSPFRLRRSAHKSRQSVGPCLSQLQALGVVSRIFSARKEVQTADEGQ